MVSIDIFDRNVLVVIGVVCSIHQFYKCPHRYRFQDLRSGEPAGYKTDQYISIPGVTKRHKLQDTFLTLRRRNYVI